MAEASTNIFPATGDARIDGLLSGAYWELGSDRVITWSLAESPDYHWNPKEAVPVIQAAFDAWEAVIDIDFVYKGYYPDYRTRSADIVLTITDSTVLGSASTLAIGVFPNSNFADSLLPGIGETTYSYPHPEGDIAFNIDSPIYDWTNPGSLAFQTVLHEIGHAIGLKHPHDGGMAGYTTYAQAGIPEYDSGFLTLMSYDPTSFSWTHGRAATPLPLDILAAQTMYGANKSTHSGDDIHRLTDDGVLRTIYDVAGNDILDASTITHGVMLNLNQGYWSYLGSDSTVYIAFNTIIENAHGTLWADTIFGNSDNNYLKGWGDDDIIEGGDGLDTAMYSYNKSSYSIRVNKDYTTVTDNLSFEGRDTLYNIERLSFSDSNIALDIDGNAGQAYRIYKAAFNRIPDLDGLGFWINELDRGSTLLSVASGFTNSAEFRSLYGNNASNDSYLNLLYNNVLGRDGDAGGHNFWLGHLNSGAISREQILIDFSESVENQANVIALIANGIEYTLWS